MELIKFIKVNYIVLSLLIFNIVIKLCFITTQPISHDEPFTIYHAQFDFFKIIEYLKNYNNPPFFELLLHFWIKIFGISALSVRFLPMLFSSFSVVVLYQLCILLFNNRVALIASLLMTFSTFQIYYAHDARVYSLFLLATLFSFYHFYAQVILQRYSFSHLFWIIISNVLLVYAHYFGFIVWFIQFVILILFYRKNIFAVKSYSITTAICLILYVPHLIILFERFTHSAKNGTWLNPPHGFESIYNMLWSFCNAPVITVAVIALFVVSILKFVVKRDLQVNESVVTQIVLWFLIPFLGMFFISYKIPMFIDRYLIFITPAFYILIALSIQYLFNKKVIIYMSSSLLIAGFIFSCTLNPSKKRNIKEVVNFVTKNKSKSTIVIICSFDFATTFAYYYDESVFKTINQNNEYNTMVSSFKKQNIYFVNSIDSEQLKLIENFDSLLYVDAAADFSVPGNNINETLNTKYTKNSVHYEDNLFKINGYSIR